MKSFISLAFLVLAWCPFALAQTAISKNIAAVNNKSISMKFEYANVQISTWNQDQIQITGKAMINNGAFDDRFDITITEEVDRISIRTKIKDQSSIPKIYTIEKEGQKYFFKDTPEGEQAFKQFQKDNEDNYSWSSNGVSIEIDLEIKIPEKTRLEVESLYGDIDISNASGMVEVNNTYGHVNVVFANNPIMKPVNLKSVYDFVDVSLPPNTQADLQLKSGYGEIFTNMEVKIKETSNKRLNHGSILIASLNGGGVEMKVEATYNNIYLRKRS